MKESRNDIEGFSTSPDFFKEPADIDAELQAAKDDNWCRFSAFMKSNDAKVFTHIKQIAEDYSATLSMRSFISMSLKGQDLQNAGFLLKIDIKNATRTYADEFIAEPKDIDSTDWKDYV